MSQHLDFSALTLGYNTANTRLLLLDYDGTLLPFQSGPDPTNPAAKVKELLIDLASDRRNHVMVISGRDKENLAASLGQLPVILAAEHGAYYRNPGNTWRRMFAAPNDWVPNTLPALNALTFQYEGSLLEAKTYSLAWHYRAIADKITESEKQQILSAIKALSTNAKFIVYDQDCTIELRTPGIDKGSFVSRWKGSRPYDFIMAIGDGTTDEDLFKVLDERAYTIKVEPSEESTANFHLTGQQDVVPLLERLIKVNHQFDQSMVRTGLLSRLWGKGEA